MCIFFRDIPALAEKPAIVRKRDGGFNYATSDLATIDYRVCELNADKIWYVVGAPQQLHFQQIFAATKMRGKNVDMTHVAHGSILGSDRKIMKTRDGDNVQLLDVLQEAVERASAIVKEKNPTLSKDEQKDISEAIGLGAVKYAELSQHRMTDYIFSWDKMLSFQGNTAPYLMNAYVRTRAIFRKLGDDVTFSDAVTIEADGERALAIKLTQFGETVPDILNDFRPNLLANYLFELAQTFHSFYEECPILKSEGGTRASRLVLCELTSRVLKQGLDLLGIRVTDRM
jgi:arginyl-tRNA synthetase